MTKKKAFREPESYKTSGYLANGGAIFDCGRRKVRVIGERDYQRLLKAAREKKS